MAPEPQKADSAMRRLGEVLRFHREVRQLTTRRVADMCGVSQRDVESWEEGRTVPDNKAWGKFRGIVHRKISEYHELRARANAEAELLERAERAELERVSAAPKPQKFGTSLGEKLAPIATTVVATPTPVPTSEAPAPPTLTIVRDAEAIPAKRPRRVKAAIEREQWARLQLRQRPRMPIGGPDGLLVLMRNRFGIGMDNAFAQQIKEEVLREFEGLLPAVPAGASSLREAPQEPRSPTPATRTDRIDRTPEQTDEDIQTAVQLIVDAVPELKTFTIKVDDQGAAHVEYEIRKVRVETLGGSMTVKPEPKRQP